VLNLKHMTPETTEQICSRLNLAFSGEKLAGISERMDRAAEHVNAEKLIRAKDLLKASGIPTRHSRAPRLMDDDWHSALELVASRPDGIWVVHGKPGTGKTQLGVEAIRAACADGQSAQWVTTLDLLIALRDCFRADSKRDEIETLNSFTSKKLLVLDEFHRRKGSDWDLKTVFQIVDRVYFKMHRLIIITNQTELEFVASTDPAMVSRIREVGGFIDCKWPSFRNT